MSPSADSLRYSSTANRRVVNQPGPSAQSMALQRSEFEDFMNAYRPTVEVTRNEGIEYPKVTIHDESKADFGRSLKKLMKRSQTSSPSVVNRNLKKETGSQRLPAPRERSVTNELKPVPVSQVKKASRPASVVVVEPTAQPTLPVQQQKPPTPPVADVKISIPPKPDSAPKNSGKLKSERNGSHDQQKLMPEVLPPAVTSQSPVVIKRKPSLQEMQKDVAMLMSTSQPPTPTGERDVFCLLIGRNSLGRFFPSRWNPDPLLSLRVSEIPERKFRIILELEESAAIEKMHSSNSGLIVVSPDGENYRKDSWDQIHAFSWIKESRVAASGILLENVEKWTEFPYVTYLMVSGGTGELCQKVNQIRSRPLPVRHNQLHFLAGYEEVVTVCRPPFSPIPEKPVSDRTGFVVLLYQVLPGDDKLCFEQNWVMWTGARQLYSQAPDYMGLKRISILKSVLPTQIIIYAMLCEFSTILDHLTEACVLVDRLRARCCGFAGIYRVLDTL